MAQSPIAVMHRQSSPDQSGVPISISVVPTDNLRLRLVSGPLSPVPRRSKAVRPLLEQARSIMSGEDPAYAEVQERFEKAATSIASIAGSAAPAGIEGRHGGKSLYMAALQAIFDVSSADEHKRVAAEVLNGFGGDRSLIRFAAMRRDAIRRNATCCADVERSMKLSTFVAGKS